MKSGLFITGTDTEVGKTFVCAELVRSAFAQGLDVGYMKPVASGCHVKGDELESEDIEALRKTGLDDPSEDINPIRYRKPASPYQASLTEGDCFSWDAITEAFDRISRHDYVLVEGIGGLSVPLTGDVYVSDLAARLDLPVVIVAANKLGVINHTLLTCAAAIACGLTVKGIIMNRIGPEDDDITIQSNGAEIQTLTGLPVLASIPFREEESDSGPALDALKIFNS